MLLSSYASTTQQTRKKNNQRQPTQKKQEKTNRVSGASACLAVRACSSLRTCLAKLNNRKFKTKKSVASIICEHQRSKDTYSCHTTTRNRKKVKRNSAKKKTNSSSVWAERRACSTALENRKLEKEIRGQPPMRALRKFMLHNNTQEKANRSLASSASLAFWTSWALVSAASRTCLVALNFFRKLKTNKISEQH